MQNGLQTLIDIQFWYQPYCPTSFAFCSIAVRCLTTEKYRRLQPHHHRFMSGWVSVHTFFKSCSSYPHPYFFHPYLTFIISFPKPLAAVIFPLFCTILFFRSIKPLFLLLSNCFLPLVWWSHPSLRKKCSVEREFRKLLRK